MTEIVALKKALEAPERMQALARVLPPSLSPERVIEIAYQAVQTNPALRECTTESIVACVQQAAQLGLVVDGVLGQAYMVPYRTRDGTKRAQFQLGYRGLMTLAFRSGRIVQIDAEVVYARDEFHYSLGANPILEHKPAQGDRGEKIAAYAVARLVTGQTVWKVLTAQEIEQRRRASRAGSEGPWVTWPEAMWRKTAVRALCRTLDLPTESQAAIAADDYAEVVEPEPTPTQGSRISFARPPEIAVPAPAPIEGINEQELEKAFPPTPPPAQEPPKPRRVQLLDELRMAMRNHDVTPEQVRELCTKRFGKSSAADLTEDEIVALTAAISEMFPPLF